MPSNMEKKDIEYPSENKILQLQNIKAFKFKQKQNIRTYVKTHGLTTQNQDKQMLTISTKSINIRKNTKINNSIMTVLGTINFVRTYVNLMSKVNLKKKYHNIMVGIIQ